MQVTVAEVDPGLTVVHDVEWFKDGEPLKIDDDRSKPFRPKYKKTILLNGHKESSAFLQKSSFFLTCVPRTPFIILD